MKVVAISDTHGLHDHVQVPPCDLLIHAGDCTDDIGRASLRRFLVWLERQPARYKTLTAGNHDGAFEKWPKEARAMVKEVSPSVTYLEDSGCTIEGIKLWGSPVTPTFFDWHFNRDRGAVISKHWDLIPDDIDILITHGPVKGVLDLTYDGRRDGDEDLLRAIERVRPHYHIAGHFHLEGGQTRAVNGTTHINASVCDERYHPVHEPVVFEIT